MYFFPREAAKFIEFLKAAFGAQEIERFAPSGTVLHAQVRIGDTCVELGEAHGQWQPVKTTIFLSVPDCDAAYQRAVSAGAISVTAPADAPYGFRLATVSDGFENTWYITAPMAAKQS